MKDIATTVSRQRKIANVPKMQPTELKHQVIPECFKTAYLGDKFVKNLHFDAGSEAAQHRFLLFASHVFKVWTCVHSSLPLPCFLKF